MKLVVVLVVQVVAILASAGSSVGDQAPSIALNLKCGGMDTIYFAGVHCLDTTSTDLALVLQYETMEEQKEFFKNYCQKQPQIRECLADVALTSQSCQNETHHQHFLAFRDLLESTLDVGCVGDGEVLANMVMIYKNDSTELNLKYLHQCLATYATKMYTSLAFDYSDYSRNYIIYRDVLNARACFEHIEDGDPRIKTRIVSLLNAIIENYSCIQPQDNSVVRCNSLNLNGTGTHRVCPIKLKEGTAKPLYDVLSQQIPMSFDVINKDEIQSISTLTSLEESRSFVKNQCKKVHIIRNNLHDVELLSWLCMDQPHHSMLETMLLFLTNALDHLCAEDGRYLADVIFKYNSDVANNSSDIDTITECLHVAKPPELDGNFTSEKTVAYYQALKVFKECFINKLRDDDVAASSAELLLSGVLNSMKCPNSDHTAMVLCETIANTN